MQAFDFLQSHLPVNGVGRCRQTLVMACDLHSSPELRKSVKVPIPFVLEEINGTAIRTEQLRRMLFEPDQHLSLDNYWQLWNQFPGPTSRGNHQMLAMV